MISSIDRKFDKWKFFLALSILKAGDSSSCRILFTAINGIKKEFVLEKFVIQLPKTLGVSFCLICNDKFLYHRQIILGFDR